MAELIGLIREGGSVLVASGFTKMLLADTPERELRDAVEKQLNAMVRLSGK